MSFKALIAAVCIFGAAPGAFAQDMDGPARRPSATLTIVIDGTAGPILSGSDPLGLNGQSATVTVLVSESIKPKNQKGKSATYKIPAGAITLDIGGSEYQTTSPSKMTVKLGGKSDKLTLVSAVSELGQTVDIKIVATLAADSWTSGVLDHPAPFQPSPQNLTSPSSTIKYSSSFLGTTVLGINGTASNSDALDPVLPDDE